MKGKVQQSTLETRDKEEVNRLVVNFSDSAEKVNGTINLMKPVNECMKNGWVTGAEVDVTVTVSAAIKAPGSK